MLAGRPATGQGSVHNQPALAGAHRERDRVTKPEAVRSSSQRKITEDALLLKVILPAEPPVNLAKTGSKVLAGAVLGALSGQALNGAVLGGMTHGRGLSLNEKINVPTICSLCGLKDGIGSQVLTKVVTNLGGGAPKDSEDRTTLQLRIPVCAECQDLRASSMVGLVFYGEVNHRWWVNLTVTGTRVANQYLSVNPGSELRRLSILADDAPASRCEATSPDGKRAAVVKKVGEKSVVVADGIQSKEYDGILSREPAILYSDDSQSIVYGALLDDQWVMVVDGVEGKSYDWILAASIKFAPNSRRLAYVAGNLDKFVVVMDGSEGKSYDSCSAEMICFSPNGQRSAYAAKIDNKWVVVLDGSEIGNYREIGALAFSPDSRRFAYFARTVSIWNLIVDGIKGPDCHYYEAPVAFSPDSQRIAYGAKVGRFAGLARWTVVVDGQAGKGFDNVKDIAFSPDGRRVALVTRKGRGWVMVVDGHECGEVGKARGLFDHDQPRPAPGAIVFSPDSKSVTYEITPGAATKGR